VSGGKKRDEKKRKASASVETQKKKGDGKPVRERKLSKSSVDATTDATSTTKAGGPRKSEIRLEKRRLEKDEKDKERAYLEEKYDINLRDSDDSSDEETLLRNGNVPKKWYDLYDHKGYGVDGK